MLSRARRGACEMVAGAALWRCRCEIVADAALWRRRCRSRGRRSILCIWVCVCVAGVAFGSCLEGQDVVARAAGGVRNRGRRSTLAMPLPKSWQAQHSVHLGVEMPLPKSWQAQHSVFVWQGQHFVIHWLAFILTLIHTSRMSKGSSTRLI